jgi:uncharacterized protein YkwD
MAINPTGSRGDLQRPDLDTKPSNPTSSAPSSAPHGPGGDRFGGAGHGAGFGRHFGGRGPDMGLNHEGGCHGGGGMHRGHGGNDDISRWIHGDRAQVAPITQDDGSSTSSPVADLPVVVSPVVVDTDNSASSPVVQLPVATDNAPTAASPGAPANVNGAAAVSNDAVPANIQAMLTALNASRALEGKAPLTLDPEITKLAQAHSDDMQAKQSMFHNSLADILATGSMGAAQNVTGAGFDAESANAAFYNEKNNPGGEQGHYQNMIGDYTKVGIGVSADGRWTVDFAK